MRKMIIFCSALLAMAISAQGRCPDSPVGAWVTLKLQYSKVDYGTGRMICEYDSFMSRSFTFTSLGQCQPEICYNMRTNEIFR